MKTVSFRTNTASDCICSDAETMVKSQDALTGNRVFLFHNERWRLQEAPFHRAAIKAGPEGAVRLYLEESALQTEQRLRL